MARTRTMLDKGQKAEIKGLLAKGKGALTKAGLATKYNCSVGTISNIVGTTPDTTRGKPKRATKTGGQAFFPLKELRVHKGELTVSMAGLMRIHFE